ncbi:MAP3K12-binding inhibitory protein 1 [Lamellibrachia satsuma]|nr:MAP3K12-binding inhibitory protein 1 [Lamellibrachia satsuma]
MFGSVRELNDQPSEMPSQSTSSDGRHTEQTGISTDPALVQIHASKSQIERRIEAFMQRKQIQVDNANRQLFCGTCHPDEDCSCARVDAVYGLARINGPSHIKVSRIVNCHGPRLHPYASPVRTGGSTQQTSSRAADVEERLANMEAHLKVTPSSTASAGQATVDIYKRLRTLEERILEMESFSPEYFQCLPSTTSQRKRTGPLTAGDSTIKYQNMCLSEIDKRIHSLRQKLQQKKM